MGRGCGGFLGGVAGCLVEVLRLWGNFNTRATKAEGMCSITKLNHHGVAHFTAFILSHPSFFPFLLLL